MLPVRDEEVPPDQLVVLVVDDNVDAAESLCCLLGLLGCKAAVAYDGPGAVQVGLSSNPHLVIVDLDLPGFDGCEVLRRLKAQREASPPFSVCLTGGGGPRDRTRCLEAGFDEFWTKPLETAHLTRVLSTVSRIVP
ncbi:response regulator [Aquabacterium sp. A7-Y]|uniref:response regulator n=1 Tax=Aquabacterium sp. A7-Y TaxID=1349605 RepID=UPI0039FCB1D3